MHSKISEYFENFEVFEVSGYSYLKVSEGVNIYNRKLRSTSADRYGYSNIRVLVSTNIRDCWRSRILALGSFGVREYLSSKIRQYLFSWIRMLEY